MWDFIYHTFKRTSWPTTISWKMAEDTKPTSQKQNLYKYNICISSSCTPSPRVVMWSWPGGCYTHSTFASQLRNPKVEHKSFIMNCRKICLTFVPKWDIVFIMRGSEQTCPLLQRETLSLSSKAVCSKISLKR